jgi:hypothetical protein
LGKLVELPNTTSFQERTVAMFESINFLLIYIQQLEKTISWLLRFIAKYIPLGQMAYDDSHSPEY